MKLPGMVGSWSLVLTLILLAVIILVGIIVYRMAMVAALAASGDEAIKSNFGIIISITGAAINLVCILIFNYFYGILAEWLTEQELHRTQTSFDDSLTIKIYLFQFVNYYASIFYIAFFKGQFVGTPHEYNRIFDFRQEECSPGGCFIELSIQLATIFMGKQFVLAVVEYYMPLVEKLLNLLQLEGLDKKEEVDGEKVKSPQHIKDYKLAVCGQQTLFYEYLEMVIQYGFITVFVCAFPLAPFFAWFNNILEIRLDAKKMLTLQRRPVAQKVRSIGVWFDIMETLSRISIITNAFIIALTSEFIPKMVYTYAYTENQDLVGYVNFTLSHFDGVGNVPECRYSNFYTPGPDYKPSIAFYHIWFARLLFVIIFENVIATAVTAVKLLIPDVSPDLKYKIQRERFISTTLVRAHNKEMRNKRNTLAP